MQKKLIEKKEKLKSLEKCPFCEGKVVKKGIRKKKFESVQVYFCKNCNKKITPMASRGRTFPLRIIIDALTSFNRLTPLIKIPDGIKEKYGVDVSARTISKWIEDYKDYIPFLRMREFAGKKFSSKNLISEAKLVHKQIYDFKFHNAKLDFVLSEDFKNYQFRALREFLNLAAGECPHQIFCEGSRRASDFGDVFNLDGVKIVPRENSAIKIARFVMQAVNNNKARHEVLQDFMISNDSVTVATEVPVLLNYDDIRHYKHELNFEIPFSLGEKEYLTGHIDLIQVRNGMIHIMDFKPSAKKEKPIAQLVFYALALSRLTGIRLYHFKCAWFDDKNYYEFFPLHVVYKKKKKRRFDRKQTRLEWLMVNG